MSLGLSHIFITTNILVLIHPFPSSLLDFDLSYGFYVYGNHPTLLSLLVSFPGARLRFSHILIANPLFFLLHTFI